MTRYKSPNGMTISDERLRRAGEGRTQDECWPYPDLTNLQGYGVYRFPRSDSRRSQKHASRVALERALGRELGPDELACHTCDNKPCVNPAHLYAGSRRDNARDMRERNRQAHVKLTTEQIIEIRARYARGGVLQRELAAEYGVTQAYVSKLVLARDWVVTDPRPRGPAYPKRTGCGVFEEAQTEQDADALVAAAEEVSPDVG